MERLKERLRDQDARLEATTRLLTSIRIPDPVAATPTPPPQSRAPLFAALGGALALVIVAGFLYLRSQAARPVDQGQTAGSAQPQLAASLPATAQPPVQVAATQPPAPALPPQPVAQPVTQPGQAPPMEAPPPPQEPSSTLQVPAAQPPEAQAKAEPPPLPLPDSQQGPPPDEAPPPIEKPAVDHLMSQNLTDYLHNHKLPFVDAMVYAKNGNPTSISLSGQVRTETGKDDAETKSRIFLGLENVKVHNRVRINPELAANHVSVGAEEPPTSGAPVESAAPETAANSCTDLCQKDDGHCKVHCQNATIGNASGSIAAGGLVGGVAAVLGTVAQTGAQSSDCAEDCQQTLEHCTADCNSGGGGSNERDNGPPEGGGGGGEGADQPPS